MRLPIITLFSSICIFLTSFAIHIGRENMESELELSTAKINDQSPSCLRMYESIEKYSAEYNIPKKYAYGIAHEETGYNGPFDWDYEHRQTSPTGALGPMQIIYSTAKWMWKEKPFSRDDLKNNVDLNVKISMKYLRMLHNQYGDWKVVFGYYNTGYPVVNGYANDVYNFSCKGNGFKLK